MQWLFLHSFPRTARAELKCQVHVQREIEDSSSDSGRTAVPGDSVLTTTRSFSVPASMSGRQAGFSAPGMTADGPMAAPGRPSRPLALSPDHQHFPPSLTLSFLLFSLCWLLPSAKEGFPPFPSFSLFPSRFPRSSLPPPPSQ